MKPFNNPRQPGTGHQWQRERQYMNSAAYVRQKEQEKQQALQAQLKVQTQQLQNALNSIGAQVKYGPLGRPSQIGDFEVKYGPLGRASQIGDFEIKYDALGQPSWTGISGLISNPLDKAAELINLLRFNKKELAVLLVLLIANGKLTNLLS